MEDLISRQTVARRRRPFAPLGTGGGPTTTGALGTGAAISAWNQAPARRTSAPPASRRPAGKTPVAVNPSFLGGLGGGTGSPTPRRPKARRGFPLDLKGSVRTLLARIAAAAAVLLDLPRRALTTLNFRSTLRTRPARNPRPAPVAERLSPTRGLLRHLPGLGRLTVLAGGLLGLALLGLLVATLARPRFPLPEGGLLPGPTPGQAALVDPLLDYLSPELLLDASDGNLDSLPIPKAMELSTYKVRPGDSLAGVAKRFGLSQDTLVSINGIKSLQAIKAGAELKVPNMNGILHVIGRGDSLLSIAKRYGVELTALADANDLGSGSIRVGQTLFIPGARLPEATLKALYGTRVAWPTRGPLSSYFGYRADPFTGVRRYHAGIDIVVNMGTPVKAAMAGVVADSGYNANYGNYVILSHGGGLQTLYGHLSSSSVRQGQKLDQGQVLGLSGNTGYSTGPHLHFGVYKGGAAIDPLKLLK